MLEPSPVTVNSVQFEVIVDVAPSTSSQSAANKILKVSEKL